MSAPQTPQTPEPGKGGPNRRLAAEIDAREYARHRPGVILLLGAAVIAAMVLVDIVRTHLGQSQNEIDAAARASRRAAAAAAPAATATGPGASERVLDRSFEQALAELRARSAASAQARERTADYRSQLQRTIAAARLELEIEQFECGPYLCIGALLGDAAAYARFGDAARRAPQRPISAFADWSAATADADSTRHRFLLPLSADTDKNDAPAPARDEPDARP